MLAFYIVFWGSRSSSVPLILKCQYKIINHGLYIVELFLSILIFTCFGNRWINLQVSFRLPPLTSGFVCLPSSSPFYSHMHETTTAAPCLLFSLPYASANNQHGSFPLRDRSLLPIKTLRILLIPTICEDLIVANVILTLLPTNPSTRSLLPNGDSSYLETSSQSHFPAKPHQNDHL